MYTYKFVKIELKARFMSRKPKQDYSEVIHSHAKEGWRLVQIFAPAITGYGAAHYFELILEKETASA